MGLARLRGRVEYVVEGPGEPLSLDGVGAAILDDRSTVRVQLLEEQLLVHELCAKGRDAVLERPALCLVCDEAVPLGLVWLAHLSASSPSQETSTADNG